MSDKVIAPKGQDPRVLSASEIRVRVEEIAEELAHRIRSNQSVRLQHGQEAFPLDTRQFINMMSEFIRMN